MDQKEFANRLLKLPIGSTVNLEFTEGDLVLSLELLYKAVKNHYLTFSKEDIRLAFLNFAATTIENDAGIFALWGVWQGKFNFITEKEFTTQEAEELSELALYAKEITIRKKRRSS